MRRLMLVCENINSYYGPAHILFDVSLRVEPDTRHAF